MASPDEISPETSEFSASSGSSASARPRVLIITYYWPPSGGAGVQRFLKFAKYLPGTGIDPVVLTCANPTYPIQDPTLTADIPDGLPVHYARTVEPFGFYGRISGLSPEEAASPATRLGSWENNLQRTARWLRANLFIPDARIGWVPFVRRKALKLLQQHGIETVITTGPPHSTHFAGRWLKRKAGVRWVADFRDPWTDIHYNRALPRTPSTRRRDLRMEISVLREADEVTVTAPGTADYFARKVERTYHTIPNGYDPDDFISVEKAGHTRLKHEKEPQETDRMQTEMEPQKAFREARGGEVKGAQQTRQKTQKTESGDRFLIRHVGSITETCIPENLLLAVRDRSDPRLQVEFIGMVHPGLHKIVQQLGLEDTVSVHPYVPHRKATALMQQSDLNVVVVHRSEDSRILIPGKLYDYLYAGRPVMVIGPPDGDAAAIVRRCRIGRAFDYEDTGGPARWIARLTGADAEKETIHPDPEAIALYSRLQLTRRLSRLLTPHFSSRLTSKPQTPGQSGTSEGPD